MMTETAAKKDTQKLQRAIVDGLEGVKAIDIQVFNTEHLSALFERVIVASGASNRQTKALAASVRDAVRDAGFSKPRMEGETNGEWIIVDCGQAVVHIMQPNIRQYYHLEDLWGDKPVRLKFGSDKPAGSEAKKVVAKTPAPGNAGAATTGSTSAPASLKRSNAAKKGVLAAFPSKAQLKKEASKKAPARKSTAGIKQPTAAVKMATVKVKAPVVKRAKPAAKKSPLRKT